MKLTKLEIYGFKSFADKLELNFGNGITAIVGPNGCGKSNVSDAVRWVLGEQSAKQLRGKGMQDLIFGGTENRKSMSYCEVSLFFDNTERFFPLEFDEVSVTRKLYKSGESEYLLNRKPVRLRDLQDLLRDAGLGNEGYTVVGQGRMDAILNAKPENRRAIFEEALGISKFRARKGDTKRKLERTEVNMNRLRDIMSVLERQLLPLERQAENAKKFLSLRDELKYHDINGYLYNYDNATSNKERFASKITAITEELAYNESKYTEATERYDSLLAEINALDKEIATINESATELKVELERRTGEHNVKLERIKAFESNLESCAKELENAEATVRSGEERLALIEKELKEKNKELNKLSLEAESLAKENVEISGETLKKRAVISQVGEGVMDVIDKLTLLKSEKASLDAEKQSLEERAVEVGFERDRLLCKIENLSESEKEELNKLTQLEQERKQAKIELDSLAEKRKVLSDKLNVQRALLADLSHSEMKARVQAEMLRNTVANYEGYSETVKRLLSVAERDKELRKRILGTVASVMKVPEKYEKAVVASLGGAMQYIVTENEESARYIIDYLRATKAGRVTFLPLASVKQNRFGDRNALRERGALTVAENIIECEDRFKPIVSNLLGATLIVDTTENAIAISKRFGYSFRIVTLTGELFSTQGSITGGAYKRDDVNALSAERLLGEAERAHKVCEEKRKDAENALNVAQSDYNTVKVQYAEKAECLSQAEIALATLRERVSSGSALTENERNAFSKLEDELTRINARLESIAEEESLKKGDIELLTKKRAGLSEDADEDRRAYEQLVASKEKIAEKLSVARLAVMEKQGQIRVLSAEKETLTSAIGNAKNVVAEKNKAAENWRFAIDMTEKELYAQSKGDEMYENLATLTETVKIKTALKEQLTAEFSSRDKERESVNNDILRLMQAKSREQFNLEKVDSDLEALQEKIFEEYGLTYSAALRFKDDDYKLSANKRESTRLRNEIVALGNINLDAVGEFKKIKAEYDENDKQLKDLEKAEEDLNKIMDDLTKEMTMRFNRGFEKISENFSVIFKELFGGGKATMRIEKDPDKEEMDYGIEIEAQPPGKKLQNISLLSGGERALTCISILFAILRLNPMPFCVLDEIEAPLDDSNAQRVAKYIEKFAVDTQFVVITHKKPTMESAQRLFGVTMQEKGVSKIVSVQLTDAVKHSISA